MTMLTPVEGPISLASWVLSGWRLAMLAGLVASVVAFGGGYYEGVNQIAKINAHELAGAAAAGALAQKNLDKAEQATAKKSEADRAPPKAEHQANVVKAHKAVKVAVTTTHIPKNIIIKKELLDAMRGAQK